MTAGYYRHPSICGDRVVFVSEDDLWEVGIEGGRARRLTANPGPSAHPVLSPDGSRIAYVGRDEGVTEVHVMDADGSRPLRLTFHGAACQVVGWDGDDIIYASNAEWAFPNDLRLWAVAAGGGPPRLLPWGPARAFDRHPRHRGVLLGRHTADPARWKRYRGGQVGSIWIDREGSGDFTRLVDLAGNLTSPMWVGRRVFFISDHEGHGNLYSVTAGGRSLRRHTHHEDFYVRHARTDGHLVVYQKGADIWLLDPAEGEPRRLPIALASARPHRNRKFITPGRYLESVDLHPEGHTLAMTVRGGSFTMPLWEGAVRRHGPVSSVRRRLAAWASDGAAIVAVDDALGEDSVVIDRLDGSEPRRIEGDFGRVRSLHVAPAGRGRVALTNHRHQLILVDTEAGRHRVVHRSPHSWIAGVDWSADGRWLAFSAATTRTSHSIFLYDSTGRSGPVAVTGPGFDDRWPSFDPDGRYLYFTSARVFDPVPDTHFHDYAFPNGSRPHLLTLRADIPSPFDAAGRPPRPPGAPPGGKPGSSKGEEGDDAERGEETPPVEIDLEGISSRVVAFPLPPGRYGPTVGAKGRVFVLSFPISGTLDRDWLEGEPPGGRLEAWDFTSEKVEQVAEGVTALSVNRGGTVLALRCGWKVRVVPIGWKDDRSANSEPGRASGWVDLGRVRVEVDPGAEWRQMFAEAWRLQRHHFWREDMSEVDWVGVRDRYLPLVDRVGARSEFSDLLWEMQGELGTSHAYELGGDYRPVPSYRQGLLGADLERRRGAWRIARILDYDPWSEAASPLAVAGKDVAVGDRLVAVDGVDVGQVSHPAALLVDRGGRPVELTLRRGRRAPHRVVVTPLTSDTALRYRDWVETNRARVRELSGDRAGYLHIPDMGPAGFAEFHRAWLTEVDKEGLVVDVRYNRGGNVSQLLTEKLARRRIGWGLARWREPEPVPADSPAGPMVCLTNEMAGSDGDIFSHTFKLLGLGPLIGTRTWGGVIGIWPQQSLVDGTVTTQPEFAFWFDDVGFSVENYGTDPDLEVVIRPQDYAAGADPQLERGVAELVALMDRHSPSLPDLTTRVSLAPPRLGS